MAVKKVSISNLPVATRSEVDASLFMASTRAPGSTTMQSKQLSYGELYSKIISDVRTELGLNSSVGSDTKPIYVNSNKMFSASTKNIGGIADTTDYGKTFTPIYMKNGELCAANINVGSCSYDGHTCTPIYMNNGALRPATSHIGSNAQPIYMDRGTLKALTYSSEAGASLAANQTPIVMTNGQISKMQQSIGKSVTNDVQPIYVNNGRITSIGNSVGSATNPVYINASGHIVPGRVPLYEYSVDFPPTGDLNTPIYIDDNGVFQPAEIIDRDKALITGKRFELLQTVLFSDQKTYLSDDYVYSSDPNNAHYNDPTAEFRVAHPSRYSDGTDGNASRCYFRGMDNPVNFKIEEDGWYLIHAEGSGSNPMAVGIKVNGSWTHKHPFFKRKDNGRDLYLPNLIYIDSATRSTINPIFHFEAGIEIGVYSCIKSKPNIAAYNADTWYIGSGSTSTKFKGKALKTLSLPVSFTVDGVTYNFPTNVDRGSENDPYFMSQFETWLKSNPTNYKNQHFWVYHTYELKKLYVYHSGTTYSWQICKPSEEKKHGKTVLTAKNPTRIYDYDYARSADGKNAIWGSTVLKDIYKDNTFLYVVKGSKKHYTGDTKRLESISYITVDTNYENWGDNDVVELLYLS